MKIIGLSVVSFVIGTVAWIQISADELSVQNNDCAPIRVIVE